MALLLRRTPRQVTLYHTLHALRDQTCPPALSRCFNSSSVSVTRRRGFGSAKSASRLEARTYCQ